MLTSAVFALFVQSTTPQYVPVTDPELLRRLNETENSCELDADGNCQVERPDVQGSAELGPGPHTMLISTRATVTKLHYNSGPACQATLEVIEAKQRAPSCKEPCSIDEIPIVISQFSAICIPTDL